MIILITVITLLGIIKLKVYQIFLLQSTSSVLLSTKPSPDVYMSANTPTEHLNFTAGSTVIYAKPLLINTNYSRVSEIHIHFLSISSITN